jgi:hypothetical protein
MGSWVRAPGGSLKKGAKVPFWITEKESQEYENQIPAILLFILRILYRQKSS